VGFLLKVGVVAVILLVLLGIADVGARIYAQGRAETQIGHRVPGSRSSVHISSFPFVGKLAATGKVDKITARVKHASAGIFSFDEVDVVLKGVRINRNQLLSGHVEVDSINIGTVKADMSEQAVDQALGGRATVHLAPGGAQVTIAGVTVTAPVALVNSALQLTVAGQAISIPIPKLPLLPCVATVAVVRNYLEVSCTFHQVPTAFLSTS
jgi:hypothetical protein